MKATNKLLASSLFLLLASGASSAASETSASSRLATAYHRLRSMAQREARRLTRDRLLAEELAHDTATHLLLESETRGELLAKAASEQERIVRTATRNRHRDRLRKEGRQRRRLERLASAPDGREPDPSPADLAVVAEDRRALDAVLHELAARDEIVRRYLAGHSVNRIHADLRVSRHRVNKVLHAAARQVARRCGLAASR